MSHLATIRGIEQASTIVGEFAGSDASRSIAVLIEATEREYIEELLDAEPARVLELQHFVRQLRTLRSVIQGKGGTPRI